MRSSWAIGVRRINVNCVVKLQPNSISQTLAEKHHNERELRVRILVGCIHRMTDTHRGGPTEVYGELKFDYFPPKLFECCSALLWRVVRISNDRSVLPQFGLFVRGIYCTCVCLSGARLLTQMHRLNLGTKYGWRVPARAYDITVVTDYWLTRQYAPSTTWEPLDEFVVVFILPTKCIVALLLPLCVPPNRRLSPYTRTRSTEGN